MQTDQPEKLDTSHPKENCSEQEKEALAKLQRTPNSKLKSAFKSPIPSNKKFYNPKSPMMNGNPKQYVEGYNMSTLHSSTEKWTISPVCSRLRDHILLLNNNSSKERIFLQSPMQINPIGWPSPAFDNYKGMQINSTAQHSTEYSNKYLGSSSMELGSEPKTITLNDSPCVIRKFMESDPLALGILQNSAYKGDIHTPIFGQEPKLVPNNWGYYKEFCCYQLGNQSSSKQSFQGKLEEVAGTFPEQGNYGQSGQPQPKVIEMQSQPDFKIMPGSCDIIENPNLPIQIYECSQNDWEGSQDDLSQDYDDEDDFCDEDQMETESNQDEVTTKKMGPNFQPNKNLIGRSYIINDTGQYERIIRKRKRKSSDQLKILMREFERNPNWSKETLLEVSKKTGLSEAQVYKWGWDQKRKTFGDQAVMMMPPFSQFSMGQSDLQMLDPQEFVFFDEKVEIGDKVSKHKKASHHQNHISIDQLHPAFSHPPSSSIYLKHNTQIPTNNHIKIDGGKFKNDEAKLLASVDQEQHMKNINDKNKKGKKPLSRNAENLESQIKNLQLQDAQRSTDKKRMVKTKSKQNESFDKIQKEVNKENIRPDKSDTQIKTRSGKDTQKPAITKQDTTNMQPLKIPREQRVLRKHNQNR